MGAIRFRLLFALLLTLAGCGDRVSPGCEQRLFEGSRFTVCRYRADRDRIALADETGGEAIRSFERLKATLGPRAATLAFAMNAGMYDEDGRPIGLYVEDGFQRHALNLASGSANFTMKPNGVFAVDENGRVEIVTSEAWQARPRRPRWATQSGPMLVIDGRLHPRIQPDGPSLNYRNGVGVDGADRAWFVISDDPVSFGRLARFFRDSLGCRNALFLDGAVSSLWDPAAGRMDQRAELGPMILVFQR